jgi:hypothetical protein
LIIFAGGGFNGFTLDYTFSYYSTIQTCKRYKINNGPGDPGAFYMEVNKMNNIIKVTVEYETPATNKFDTLMSQYQEIKKTATETISYYKPLADMAEETKLNTILAQLETIKEYLKKLNLINPDIKSISINSHDNGAYDYGKFTIDICNRIYWCSAHVFSIDYYRAHKWAFTRGEYMNILGNWDKWEVYNKLEQKCLWYLNNEIKGQIKAAETEKNRLSNIID